MLVGPDGTAVGSVSGGCVEGAVYEEAKDVVETGEPTLERYGVSDDDAFAVGPDLRRDPRRLRRVDLPGVVPRAGRDRRVGRPRTSRSPSSPWSRAPTTGWAGGWCSGRTGRRARSACSAWTTPSPPTPAACSPPAAPGCCTSGTTASAAATTSPCSSTPSRPPARMVVFGAIDFAAAVARVGAFLGYRVTVCDARPVFATPKRFPDAARGDRRVAAPLPAGRGRRRPDRRAHRALRAHPRPEVRRPAAGGRAAASRSPTSARWARGARTTSG